MDNSDIKNNIVDDNPIQMRRDPEIVCPSCGRFIGPYERCPYCGREIQKRLSIKFMKIGSLFMAVIGLAFLYLAAINKELPLIKVSEVKPTMNFAYVRVAGRAVNDAYINDYGGFSCIINDSEDGKDLSSNIKIKAYSDIAKSLKERNLMPSAGDWVEVAGSLRIREGSVSLIIQSPEQIKIKPVEIERLKLADLHDESLIGKRVLINGEIVDVIEKPGRAPNEILISDGDTSIRLVLWKNTYKDVVSLKGIGFGAVIDAKVTVSQYRGRLQYWVKKVGDIKILRPSKIGFKRKMAKSKVKRVKISEINSDMLKKIVSTKGVVKDIIIFGKRKNHKVILSDNDKTIEIIFFASDFKELPPIVDRGAYISVEGRVNVYKGNLQIIANKVFKE